ncbi:hypothetical protein A2U01_0022402, partial [Trifolium medium]|nr:hypothetical protein [Trifolium medium]
VLELCLCSQRVNYDIDAADPEHDWSFDALVYDELNTLENKLAATYSTEPLHFNKSTTSRQELDRKFDCNSIRP